MMGEEESAADGTWGKSLREDEVVLVKTGGYFHGQLYRKGAEEVLGAADVGAFLVREVDGELLLSVKTESRVELLDEAAEEEAGSRNNSGILHVKIQVNSRGYFTVDDSFCFHRVEDLIEHHLEERAALGRRPLIPASQIFLSHPMGLSDMELMPKNVELGKALNPGRFGKMHEGSLIMEDGTRRSVFIKLFQLTADRDLKRMFMADSLAFLRLGPHPNIIACYGSSLLESPVKLLKEMSPMGSLRSFLERRAVKGKGTVMGVSVGTGSLTEREALGLGVQMAAALVYVHEKSLIHLDVTSHNFYLFHSSGMDGRWRAKLSNFYHMRKSQGWELSKREADLLQPRWSSLEVLEPGHVSSASDVFSLATCLWEVLDMPPALPFAPALLPNTPLQSLLHHITYFLRSPAPHTPSSITPAPLAELMSAAWNPEPNLRPKAASFQELIRSFLL